MTGNRAPRTGNDASCAGRECVPARFERKGGDGIACHAHKIQTRSVSAATSRRDGASTPQPRPGYTSIAVSTYPDAVR